MADTSNTEPTTVSELEVTAVYGKPSRFNINSFHSEMRKNGVLVNNRFLVQLQPFYIGSKVASELGFIQSESGKLTLRCENVSLPGPKLLTNNNIRRYGYGPVEHMPHDVQFSNVTISWILDSNAEVADFFNKWMTAIINYESRGGQAMSNSKTYEESGVKYQPYNVGYKDDYACSRITIFVYDQELKQVISYDLYDAFPVSISDIPLDWNSKNTPIKYSVTFTYTDIRVRRPDDPLEELEEAIKDSLNKNFGPLMEAGRNILKKTNTLLNGVTRVIRGN